MTFIVGTHTHRHGISTYLFEDDIDRSLSLEEFAEYLDDEYEPDRDDEFLDLEVINEPVTFGKEFDRNQDDLYLGEHFHKEGVTVFIFSSPKSKPLDAYNFIVYLGDDFDEELEEWVEFGKSNPIKLSELSFKSDDKPSP